MCREVIQFCEEIAPREMTEQEAAIGKGGRSFDAGRPRWLTLMGASDAGKTHLAIKIAEWVALKRANVMFFKGDRMTYFKTRTIKWSAFCDAIMGGKYSMVDFLIEPDFLFLDEVGAEYEATSKLVFAKFGQVCDSRLGKWTVITSNHSMSSLAEIDARIASRMERQGNVVVDLGPGVIAYARRVK